MKKRLSSQQTESNVLIIDENKTIKISNTFFKKISIIHSSSSIFSSNLRVKFFQTFRLLLCLLGLVLFYCTNGKIESNFLMTPIHFMGFAFFNFSFLPLFC